MSFLKGLIFLRNLYYYVLAGIVYCFLRSLYEIYHSGHSDLLIGSLILGMIFFNNQSILEKKNQREKRAGILINIYNLYEDSFTDKVKFNPSLLPLSFAMPLFIPHRCPKCFESVTLIQPQHKGGAFKGSSEGPMFELHG